LGNSHIKIGLIEGKNSGAPAYSATGEVGIEVNQFTGGKLEIGVIRNCYRYGIFFNNGDSVSPYDTCAASNIQINELINNGVGLRAYSHDPTGSFFGGNHVVIGNAASNFIGALFGADTAASGVLTYTDANSVDNRVFMTAEDSTTTAAEAADIFINTDKSFWVINADKLRVRGGYNQIFLNDSSTLVEYFTNGYNQIFQRGIKTHHRGIENSGTATFSGDGSTVAFSFAHGLAATPTHVKIGAKSDDAAGDWKWSADATNVTITFMTAPASGTNNVVFSWEAQV
jgi:hypothetical protein